MPASGQVPFIGLTGGIGSGKSTALEALGELGVATLSADAVVHELLGGDGELRAALVERLGPHVLDAGGAVDRAAVAARVFDDDVERHWLEQLLWPRVRARMDEWRAVVEAREAHPAAAVVEVPLLFESDMEGAFDTTIAVVADEPLRAERAAARGHAAVAERTARQLSQDEKAARAAHVVRNDGTREELKAQLSRVLATING